MRRFFEGLVCYGTGPLFMECFNVDLVSPDRKKGFEGVCSLTARTSNGEFVVMANHEASVMSLLAGSVLLKQGDDSEIVVLVSRAVLSVENGSCVIIADFFVLSDDDKERLVRFKERLNAVTPGAEGLIPGLREEDLRYIDMVLGA